MGAGESFAEAPKGIVRQPYNSGMKVRLSRIESNHKNLRTDFVDGWANDLPVVGRRFQMTAPPLEIGHFRFIWTTPVRELNSLGESTYQFRTENSLYELEVLEGRA
jgi:hypothetical protein